MLQGNGQIIKKRLNNHIFLITVPGYSHIPSERQIGKVVRQFPRRFLIFLLILLIQFFHLFLQRQIRINAHFLPGCTIRETTVCTGSDHDSFISAFTRLQCPAMQSSIYILLYRIPCLCTELSILYLYIFILFCRTFQQLICSLSSRMVQNSDSLPSAADLNACHQSSDIIIPGSRQRFIKVTDIKDQSSFR